MIDPEIYEVLTKPYLVRQQLARLPAEAHARLIDALLPPAIRYDRDQVQTSPEDRLLAAAAAVDAWERKRRKHLKRWLTRANRKADKLMDAAELTPEERRVIVARCGFRMSWRRLEKKGGVPKSTACRIFESASAKLSAERAPAIWSSFGKRRKSS